MHDCWMTRIVVASGTGFGAMFVGSSLAGMAGAFIGLVCGFALGIAIQVSEARRKREAASNVKVERSEQE